MTGAKRKGKPRGEGKVESSLRPLGDVELVDHGTLAPPRDGDELVSVGVGPGGELLSLWSTPQGAAAMRSVTTHRAGVRSPDARIPAAVPARVVLQSPRSPDTSTGTGAVTVTELTGVPVAHPNVQPLPDGRILLVGARCWWRSAGPDRNAVVYDGHGQVLHEGTLGDGILHVQTTTTGQIWVGYFDEGIFGNRGWNDPGPQPLGAAGLVRYGPDLKAEWSFPTDVVDDICDCYALNVTDWETWTCYYTRFPLVRIRGDAMRSWSTTVDGAKALAVHGSTAAFAGGYGPDRDRILLTQLADDHVRITHRGQLRLSDGQPLPTQVVVQGRGPTLHAITRDRWYQITVDELAMLSG